jgi:hypothetical protein
MRTRHVFFTLLLAPLFIASAHAQQDIKPRALLGKWQTSAQHPSGAMIKTSVQFTEDLKFTTASTVNDKPFMVASGTWTLTGTKLEWRYERSSQPAIQPGYVDTDEVVAVSDSELKLASKLSGKTSTYIRPH